jgi:hypothetical protein
VGQNLLIGDTMSLTDWIKKKAGIKQEISDMNKRVNKTFPTDAHTNAAMNMYGVLDPSQGHGMNNSQWRWMDNINHPWEMKPNAFYDMMYTAEDMPQDTHNAMWRDYYTMNNLPPALNNQKNIDLLIEAAKKDMSPY